VQMKLLVSTSFFYSAAERYSPVDAGGHLGTARAPRSKTCVYVDNGASTPEALCAAGAGGATAAKTCACRQQHASAPPSTTIKYVRRTFPRNFTPASSSSNASWPPDAPIAELYVAVAAVPASNANGLSGASCLEQPAAASLASDAYCSHNAPCAEPSAAAAIEPPVRCTAACGSSTAGGTLPGAPSPEDAPAASNPAPAVAVPAACAASCFRAPAHAPPPPKDEAAHCCHCFSVPRRSARFKLSPRISSPPTNALSAAPKSWAATSARCRGVFPPSTLHARSFAAAAAAPASDANSSPGVSRPEPPAAAQMASDACCLHKALCAEPSAAAS
jgi:hypothetical protein